MHTLTKSIDSVGFVERELNVFGKPAANRCGRDFVYYALNYYDSDWYNPAHNNALQLEKSGLLGLLLPWWLMWTQLQFLRLPKFLASKQLELKINGRVIRNFLHFLLAISLPSTSDSAQKIKEIERAVDADVVSAIDISIGFFGLMDHVLFVYGYDEDNLYVFDTHQVLGLEYEKITTDNRCYMRLPKAVVAKRWTKFGRVWVVAKVALTP